MSKGISFLRFVYWLGAVMDGASVLPMVFPSLGGGMFGVDAAAFGAEYKYAMYMGAALMAGWTGLLVWGVFEPVKRRGVLLLTAIPVVLGLCTATLYACASGIMQQDRFVSLLVFQVVIFILFISAWITARRMAK